MKPVDVKSSTHILTLVKKFKIVDIVKISKYKNIFLFQIGLKNFLRLKKLKTLCRGHISLVILKAKELFERFTKKNCKNKSRRV